jgi:hypothetical protein
MSTTGAWRTRNEVMAGLSGAWGVSTDLESEKRRLKCFSLEEKEYMKRRYFDWIPCQARDDEE